MPELKEVLKERGSRYGSFEDNAKTAQNIKRVVLDGRNWCELNDTMREVIEMIAHKLGRIVNGDPYYADSWVDIAGYAQLVANLLEGYNATPAKSNESVAKEPSDGFTISGREVWDKVQALKSANRLRTASDSKGRY